MNSTDLVARMKEERDRHVIGFPGPRRNVAELLDNALDRIEALEAWKAEAMEVLLDAAAHLAAASSAYDKFAARHKDLKPRAVADPMFTTRNSDFIKASSRVSIAARRLVEKENGR